MKHLACFIRKAMRNEWIGSLLLLLYIVYVVFVIHEWFSSSYNLYFFDLLKKLPVFSPSSYPLNNFVHAIPRNLCLSALGLFSFFCIGGYGSFAVSLIKTPFSFSEGAVLSQAIGFGISGFIVFILSSAQMLYPQCLWTVMMAGFVLGILSFRKKSFLFEFKNYWNIFLGTVCSPAENKGKILKKLFFSFRILPLILIFVPMFLCFTGSLAPEPCVNDALNYHLAAPNYWLIHHGFADMPQHLFYNLFLLHGMAWASILGTFGLGALRVYYFLLSLMSLYAIFLLGKRYFNVNAALWAVALIASSAPFVNAVQETCSEIPILFLITVSVSCLLPLLENDVHLKKELFSIKDRICLAGFILGCAAAVKATCILFLPGIAAVIFFANGRDIKKSIRHFSLFSLFFVIPVFPWLIKNYVFKGNPFFPFLTSLFGLPEGYDAENMYLWMKDVQHAAGMSILSWFYGIWELFIPKIDSYNHSVSFFALIWFPLFFIISPKLNRIKYSFLIFVFISGGLFFAATNIFRFLFPVYAFSMLFFSYHFERCLYGNVRNIARIFVFFISLFCLIPAFSYFYTRGMYVVPLGIEDTSDWKKKYCPVDCVSIYDEIEKMTKPSDKILMINSGTSFYLNRDYEAFSFYDRWPLQTKALKAKSGDALFRLLREEGFTHIFYDPWGFRFTFQIRHIKSDKAAAGVIHSFWNNHLETAAVFAPLPYQKGIPSMLLKITDKRKGSPPMNLYPDF